MNDKVDATARTGSQLQNDLSVQRKLVDELDDYVNGVLTSRLKPILLSVCETLTQSNTVGLAPSSPVRSSLGEGVADTNDRLRATLAQLKRLVSELDL